MTAISVFIRELDSGEAELTLTLTEQEQKNGDWVDYRRLSASQAKGKYVEHLGGIAAML